MSLFKSKEEKSEAAEQQRQLEVVRGLKNDCDMHNLSVNNFCGNVMKLDSLLAWSLHNEDDETSGSKLEEVFALADKIFPGKKSQETS